MAGGKRDILNHQEPQKGWRCVKTKRVPKMGMMELLIYPGGQDDIRLGQARCYKEPLCTSNVEL